MDQGRDRGAESPPLSLPAHPSPVPLNESRGVPDNDRIEPALFTGRRDRPDCFPSYCICRLGPDRCCIGHPGDRHFPLDPAAIAADEITDADGDSQTDSGIALPFPYGTGFEAVPDKGIYWQSLNTEPLAESIDLLAEGDRFYVGFSYQKPAGVANINNNWLFIREHITTNGGENYSQVLVYSKQQTDPIYHDIDVRKDDNGVYWTVGNPEIFPGQGGRPQQGVG